MAQHSTPVVWPGIESLMLTMAGDIRDIKASVTELCIQVEHLLSDQRACRVPPLPQAGPACQAPSEIGPFEPRTPSPRDVTHCPTGVDQPPLSRGAQRSSIGHIEAVDETCSLNKVLRDGQDTAAVLLTPSTSTGIDTPSPWWTPGVSGADEVLGDDATAAFMPLLPPCEDTGEDENDVHVFDDDHHDGGQPPRGGIEVDEDEPISLTVLELASMLEDGATSVPVSIVVVSNKAMEELLVPPITFFAKPVHPCGYLQRRAEKKSKLLCDHLEVVEVNDSGLSVLNTTSTTTIRDILGQLAEDSSLVLRMVVNVA